MSTTSPAGITAHRPGQVRDEIDRFLRKVNRPARTREIVGHVMSVFPTAAKSTIRSSLNHNVGDLWDRLQYGWYASSALPIDKRVIGSVEPEALEAEALLVLGDCKRSLALLPDNSLDAIITDPPYCLQSLGDDWDADGRKKVTANSTIGHLPGGMAFSRNQSQEMEHLIFEVAAIAMAKLKPGGWFLAFSAPRLAHRMAVGIEDAGFEIRDQWGWLYGQNMPKGMKVKRFIKAEHLRGLPKSDCERLLAELEHWKTPQLKCVMEPVVVAQKPREGTFLENWRKYHIGLLNFEVRMGPDGASVPSSVMTMDDAWDDELPPPLSGFLEVAKPKREYRNKKGVVEEIDHMSPKPLAIMEHLIRLVVPKGGTVCDPFNGSGSTGIAALSCGRNYIGFEREERYLRMTVDRFEGEFLENELTFGPLPGCDEAEATSSEFASRWLVPLQEAVA